MPDNDDKKKKRERRGKTPITETVEGREIGTGGLMRRRKIDDFVDRAQEGQTTDSNNK